MSPEDWKRIEEIFQEALDLPEAERPGFVAGACAGNEKLQREVELLLKQYDAAGDFIEAPAVAYAGTAVRLSTPYETSADDSASIDPMAGRRVGAYRIVREVGRGGMGAVYLAERADSAFHKRVAVKVVKRGMDTDFILSRFRHERQILASFDHQNIARLFDGGSTDDGLPYFVMEYVEGQPLYRYCDGQRLSIAERLRIFCQVCDAVGYAHQHLVIHRDLKPSNVLVTAEGVPKLLDFGIAKLLNPELMPDTVTPTATAMRLMTPEYASPEQVQGLPVTPASDVYSLGVMLYELLTGHRPYRVASRVPHEVARVICEEEPEHPSRALTGADDVLPAEGGPQTPEWICRVRGGTPESIRRELAGNIDNIVMKALRKEPSRRYESVEQLRDDITRHLEGRPVSAPFHFAPTVRFPRSNGEPTTGEKSIAVLPLKTIDARRATADAGEDYLGVGLADALITRLSSLRRFSLRPTSSVLRYSDPASDPIVAGHELNVSYVLDGRIRRAGDSIRVTVQLLDVRGGSTVWAGQFDEKFTDVLHLEDAISSQVAEALVPHLSGDERVRLAKRGTDNAAAFEAYLRGRYHWNAFTEEGFAKAIISFHQAIALDPEYALAYAGIADYYNWIGVYGVLPFSECSAAAREAATKAVELDPGLAEAFSALGFATTCHNFDWAAAEAQHRRAIELNPNYATAHHWYAFQLIMEARFDEALSELRIALDLDPLSGSIQQALAWCFYHSRRAEESLAAYRKLIEAEPRFAYARLTYSWALRLAGKTEESVEEARRAVEYAGGESQFFLSSLGAACAAAGRHDEAQDVLRRLGEMAVHRYVSPYHLALIHCNLGDREMALALLQEAHTQQDGWLVWLGVEPQLDVLRDDPRFQDLLRKTRNPAALRSGAVAAESPEPSGRQPAESPSGPHPSGPRPSESGEAYQLYVAARYHERKRTAEGLREAITRYERAVEIDPRFAHAYANLSECYSLLNWYVEPPPPDAWRRAKEAAEKAVSIDAGLADAHSALGFVRLHHERDHAAAEESFRRAIQLDPGNPPARRWHAMNLSAMGRHAEAIAEIRRAQELAPRSAVIATATANILYFGRRYEEAAEQARRALEMDPGSVAARVVLRWAYECLEKHDDALAVYEEERAFAGDTPTTRAKHAHALAACGRHEEARAVLKELLSGKEHEGVTPYEIAVVYSLLGEREEGLKWLERAEREHVVGFTFARVDPHLDNLRDDPRFSELMRRASPHAGAAGSRPDGRGPAEQTAQFIVHETAPDTPEAAAAAPKGSQSKKEEAKKEDEGAAVESPAVEVRAEATAPPQVVARPRRRRAMVAGLVALAAVAAVSVPMFLYFRGTGRVPADKRPVQLTNHPATDYQPAYSPDGSRVIFTSKRDGNFEIYSVAADGSSPARLTNEEAEDQMPVYSPDGGRIAFTSKRDGNDEVYVMGADGSNPTNVTRSPASDSRPAWSPDGSRLLFVSNRDGAADSYDIYVVNADGGGLRRLTDDPAYDADPAWSPDGRRVAFASNRGGDFDIYLMDPDGGGQTNLTRNPSYDGKPAWSPDGRKLAFTSNRGAPGDSDIYVMEANGSGVRKVWDNDATDDEPAWSPDGSKLVYQSESERNVDVYAIASDAVASEKAPAPGVRSVAVLPFNTPGAKGDDQYLGVGLAEAVSIKLGQLAGLTMRPPAAVRRYLGTDRTPAEAGRELNADYVLTGTIERAGDRVMTALELTDVAAGRVLWSERLEELFTDIPTLQTSVSERVARALDLQLTRAERARLQKRTTDNGEAYALYLAGRYHMGKRTPDGLRLGISNFERAIERDPSLAVAYSGLADSYTLLNLYVEPPPPDAFARAREAALKAVALDEQQAESHVSLAFVTFYFDRDLAAAEREFRRAIALNPNYPTAHHWFALVLSAAGRHDEALAEIGRAQQLDPSSGVIATATANFLFYARRYDEAISQCEKALAIDPGSASGYTTMRRAFTMKGMHSQALAVFDKERAFAGDSAETRVRRAQVLASSGNGAEARAVLRELIARREREWVTPYEVGVAFALLGERDEALEWLARAEREHATGFAFAGVDPQLDSLREDPRFRELLRASGVSR